MRLLQNNRAELALAVAFVLCAGACRFDAERNPAFGCGACSAPDRCVDGFCVRAAALPQPRDGGARDARALDGAQGDAAEGAARCEPGTSAACYDGPAGSDRHSPCRAGRKTCSADGVYGECRGQWLPAAETCNDLDDDCDGTVDEQAAAEAALCDSGDACCDGRCVEPDSDPLHCGACGVQCKRGTRCCAGACVDPSSDPSHCGACNLRCPGATSCCDGECAETQIDLHHCGPFCLNCAAGQACCFGACADLASFQHCGSCGRVCDQGELCCSGTCSALACE